MTTQSSSLTLMSPMDGKLQPIEESFDPVFAQRMVGDGVVIEPTGDVLYAPCDGTVSQMHDAKHAVAIKTEVGVEVLMHIGIDTVTMKGEGFDALVQLNDIVQQGQPIIRFDTALIESKNLKAQSVVLVTTGQSVANIQPSGMLAAKKDTLFSVAMSNNSTSESAITNCDNIVALDVQVPNPQGLHARPAAHLVQIANEFESKVTLINQENGHESNGKSVTAIMGLNTRLGTMLTVMAQGNDAETAAEAVVTGLRGGLGEQVSQGQSFEERDFPKEPPLVGVKKIAKNKLSGVKAAQGMVSGKLAFRRRDLPSFPEQGVDINEELAQLNEGISTTQKNLLQIIAKHKTSQMKVQVEIFSAHLQLLDDPALYEKSIELIQQGKSAMFSWHQSFARESENLRSLNNPVLAARGADIEDVGLRVLRSLMGIEEQQQSFSDAILVMEDITPSEVVSLDLTQVVGLCTVQGGSTSHAAILASAIGLPYLVNLPPEVYSMTEGSRAILDASNSYLHVEPTDSELVDFKHSCQKQIQVRKSADAARSAPAVMTDGQKIEVAANIGSVSDAIKAAENGAEGIGLVRTEFLYMERTTEPSFNEQVEIYRGILSALSDGQPCLFRTLDVGGDKPLPYVSLPHEENPFLGERGIRIGLFRPEMLRKQVRAILTAAQNTPVRIMFPMIATVEEFRAANGVVQEEISLGGFLNVEVGIMIEVPSAALLADRLAHEVDFFSIGTNDLTQYTLAMDRGHPKLAAQVDALHPAVLRLIKMTANASQEAGHWTGICGSIASDPMATALLIGLGVTELSTNLQMISQIKANVRLLNLVDCQALAEKALMLDSAEDIRKLVSAF